MFNFLWPQKYGGCCKEEVVVEQEFAAKILGSSAYNCENSLMEELRDRVANRAYNLADRVISEVHTKQAFIECAGEMIEELKNV